MNKQPKPDSKRYTDLINEIDKGEIKIPKFQRDFVWSIEKTANLLDSILKGYPIGTFILWETKQRLNDIKNIGNLKLKPVPDDVKIQYVLDGQQRITSLYAAYLGAKIQKTGEKKITDYSKIYVNLDADIEINDESIITHEINEEDNFISLNDVLHFTKNYSKLRNEYEDELLTKINEYHNFFQSYDFSTVVLRNDDIDSAIEVFTRINTGGQTLTLFEIMAAKTYDEEKNFDMQKSFSHFIKELSNVQFDTISSSVLLFTTSFILSKNQECKRKIVLGLNKNDIIEVWDDVLDSIKESIDYFKSVYRIPLSALLPYDSLLVPFAYFFYTTKSRPQGSQIKYLEEFFWRASLSSRYSSSTESKLAQDIKRVNLIINNEQPEYKDFLINIKPTDLIESQFSAGNSFCKAILCLLAYNEPKDFLDNGKVNLDNNYLKMAHSKNYHHFFPKSFLKKNLIGNENSLMNITLVSDRLNKRKIGARSPSDYIYEFKESNDALEKTLKSHLINDIDSFGIGSDDYSTFLEKRAIVFNSMLDARLNLKNILSSSQNNDIKELILKDEGPKLEFKSSMRYDLNMNKVNKKLEMVIAKTISGFLNTDGGILIIGVEDNGNIIGLDNDYSVMQKSNKDGFELILREVIKKYLNKSFDKYLTITFPVIDEKEICHVVVKSKYNSPVFLTFEGNEKFFIRIGNSTQPLRPSEMSEHIKTNWIS